MRRAWVGLSCWGKRVGNDGTCSRCTSAREGDRLQRRDATGKSDHPGGPAGSVEGAGRTGLRPGRGGRHAANMMPVPVAASRQPMAGSSTSDDRPDVQPRSGATARLGDPDRGASTPADGGRSTASASDLPPEAVDPPEGRSLPVSALSVGERIGFRRRPPCGGRCGDRGGRRRRRGSAASRGGRRGRRCGHPPNRLARPRRDRTVRKRRSGATQQQDRRPPHAAGRPGGGKRRRSAGARSRAGSR